MKWKEITIYTTEEGTEIILARLDMLGITQVNIVQGDEEIDALLHSCEKYWDYADEAAMGKQPSVQAYVSDVPENAAVEQAVRNSIAELGSMRSEIGIDMGSLKSKCAAWMRRTGRIIGKRISNRCLSAKSCLSVLMGKNPDGNITLRF